MNHIPTLTEFYEKYVKIVDKDGNLQEPVMTEHTRFLLNEIEKGTLHKTLTKRTRRTGLL